jgi:hypothetical protein
VSVHNYPIANFDDIHSEILSLDNLMCEYIAHFLLMHDNQFLKTKISTKK